jgi:hypothetical protein
MWFPNTRGAPHSSPLIEVWEMNAENRHQILWVSSLRHLASKPYCYTIRLLIHYLQSDPVGGPALIIMNQTFINEDKIWQHCVLYNTDLTQACVSSSTHFFQSVIKMLCSRITQSSKLRETNFNTSSVTQLPPCLPTYALSKICLLQ